MLLRRMRLHNFGPYFGSHEIDLSTTADSPVIVIHGENERGKTSLLNAIRWCLYREARARGGFTLSSVRLLNYDAIEEGDFALGVMLEIEHAGEVYQLERTIQSERKPTCDEDFKSNDFLRRGAHILPSQEIPEFIRSILPKAVSRFFLFDGEMLNEYEALLREANANTRFVKESIERVLGVPSLERARQDLQALKDETSDRIVKDVAARKKNERLVAEVQQKESDAAAILRDVEALEKIIGDLERKREELVARRETYTEVRADVKEIEEIERSIAVERTNMKAAETAIGQLLADVWWLPLERGIDDLRNAVLSTQAAIQRSSERAAALSNEIALLETSAAAAECAMCGSVLEPQRLHEVKEKRTELQHELDAIELPSATTARSSSQIEALGKFRSDGATSLLAQYERNKKGAEIRAHDLERRRSGISERIKSVDRKDISETEREYTDVIALLAQAGRRIDEARQRRSDAVAALNRVQASVRRLPDANRRLNVRSDVISALFETFKGALDVFRNWVRADVEREATEIHRQLSTEPGYGGLRISESFGLQLTTQSGRVIADRSAGSEQVVALSLIGALSRCTQREAPIVMDTPLGRLDRGHRERVLKFLPNFGPQVILLVQSGEIERPRDLAPLEGRVSREYRIERDSAAARSFIRPIQTAGESNG